MSNPSDAAADHSEIQAGRDHGSSIPYLPINGYPGKLIAIEGTDGSQDDPDSTAARVARSARLRRGRDRLDAVAVDATHDRARQSAHLRPATRPTSPIAWRKEIIPALKAGFIVLSDRYIFTALARAGVRGIDRAWLRGLYSFAIAPHMVFYLKVDEKTLIGRILESRGMDFWESGMDMKSADDIYDSFRLYQNKLLREYASMADEFHFRTLDARRSIDHIQDELRKQVAAFLEPADRPAEAIAR